MKSTQQIQLKIHTVESLLKQVNAWRVLNKKIVFMSGVFDDLSTKNILLFNEAALYGDMLVVGVNTNTSANNTKPPYTLVNDLNTSAMVLASLLQTDAVVIFEEGSPLELIKKIKPDVLVNIGGHSLEQIAGSKEVLAADGEVKNIDIVDDLPIR
jgi:D-glycero-beta-D-manno-heptose 1-phosphate adenylyltransferase